MGYNIYTTIITEPLFHCTPGQKDRKIGLQMSVLRDMPEFKTLMKDAEIYVITSYSCI